MWVFYKRVSKQSVGKKIKEENQGVEETQMLKNEYLKQWTRIVSQKVDVVSAPGQSWSGRIVCFKTNPLECTLLARWDISYQDPWLILTDIQPTHASAVWYGLRPSTECVYRDVKSDGWQ